MYCATTKEIRTISITIQLNPPQSSPITTPIHLNNYTTQSTSIQSNYNTNPIPANTPPTVTKTGMVSIIMNGGITTLSAAEEEVAEPLVVPDPLPPLLLAADPSISTIPAEYDSPPY